VNGGAQRVVPEALDRLLRLASHRPAQRAFHDQIAARPGAGVFADLVRVVCRADAVADNVRQRLARF